MSSTSSPSGPDDPRPSAAEAARALRDMDRHRDQAHDSATHSRWVSILFGVVLGAGFAAPDFVGQEAAGWTSPAIAILTVGYVALLNTRSGSAMLGQPVRPRREDISAPFRRYALLTLLAVVLAGCRPPTPATGLAPRRAVLADRGGRGGRRRPGRVRAALAAGAAQGRRTRRKSHREQHRRCHALTSIPYSLTPPG